jgi:hypothetical protein
MLIKRIKSLFNKNKNKEVSKKRPQTPSGYGLWSTLIWLEELEDYYG